jgi:hypothetical protein
VTKVQSPCVFALDLKSTKLLGKVVSSLQKTETRAMFIILF